MHWVKSAGWNKPANSRTVAAMLKTAVSLLYILTSGERNNTKESTVITASIQPNTSDTPEI